MEGSRGVDVHTKGEGGRKVGKGYAGVCWWGIHGGKVEVTERRK